MNIFEIDKELKDIISEIEDNGGEITPELEEQLTISQKDFASKVESYCNGVKSIESDIAAIDKEIDRLQKLKKSKQATITRLENIIKWAVTTYGEITKTGTHYFDYGTGKVSLRKSQKVVVSDNLAENIVTQTLNYFRGLDFNKQLSCYNNIAIDVLLSAIKENLETDITEDDLAAVYADLNIKVPISKLIQEHGYSLVSDMFELNPKFSYKANIDKKELKSKLENENNITIGTIIDNTTVTIK